MNKKRYYQDCIILRTFERTNIIWNVITGDQEEINKEIITDKCNVPLFSLLERESGICNSCAQGWEADKNKFANDHEKNKAINRNWHK